MNICNCTNTETVITVNGTDYSVHVELDIDCNTYGERSECWGSPADESQSEVTIEIDSFSVSPIDDTGTELSDPVLRRAVRAELREWVNDNTDRLTRNL